MKDLSKCAYPLNFEVRESCDFNNTFVNHIPYKTIHKGFVTTEEYLDNAIKEMVLRYALSTDNNGLIEQFTDDSCIPGASKLIIEAVKNAVNIIAAILFKFNISDYFTLKRDPYTFEEEFIDSILINNIELCNISERNIKCIISIRYIKTSKTEEGKFLDPITVTCDVPLTDAVDRLRNKVISTAGDTVYSVLFNPRDNNFGDEITEYDNNTLKSILDLGKNEFNEITNFIYLILFNNRMNNCTTCPRNKFEQIECLGGNFVNDEELNKDALKYLFDNFSFRYDPKDKTEFNFIVGKNDIGGFNRFSNVSRRIVEYSLMINDYYNAPLEGSLGPVIPESDEKEVSDDDSESK